MSDSDIDDQLLELAGASEKKRKRPSGHSSSKSKKRKADPMATDSDDGPESEDGQEDADPYPLEGKYIDEDDRQKLLSMSEIQREEILAARVEEKQRLADKQVLAQMVRNQSRGGADSDNVANAAKRPHAQRGATKEKMRKLDELKAKRRAKDEKKRNKNGSPRRDRSSSPMDMEISDDESEDGLITKEEQLEEKERKIFGNGKPDSDDEPITVADLEKCRLSRDMVAKHCMAPWFQDYVTNSWVRYLIGQENGQAVYRICEIHDLAADLTKPYKINDKVVNQAFELKHGKSVKTFPMDKVSNGPFSEKEFDRLKKACASEEVKLPTRRKLDEKMAQMQKLASQPMTESDITAMLARKNQVQAQKQTGLSTLERSRLNQARTLAMRRHDYVEMAEIDAKLAEYETASGAASPAPVVDVLAKVNERNRKANLEAVRKAELAESERKRRDRKLAASGVAPVSFDPSARLKTVPKLFNSATPASRPGTPVNGAETTPGKRMEGSLAPSLVSGKTARGGKSVEASIIESIEIDLGDF